MKKKLKHTIKYRFICNAPSQLTEYNVEWNRKVTNICKREEKLKFIPHPTCVGCSLLEIRKLG